MANIYDMADTWTDGSTYTAIKMNVTDTSSNAASKLLDLQVGGVSKFAVDKDGVITSANGTLVSDMAETWNDVGTVFTAIKMNVTNTTSATGSKLIDLQLGGVSYFNVDKDKTVAIADGGNLKFTGIGQIHAENGYLRLLALAELPGGASSYIRGGNAVDLQFATSNTVRWLIDRVDGHLEAGTDNSWDIGQSGAGRPRNVYAGTAFILADGVTAPTATVGSAKLYVDTADGDLKVIFGDGVIKTIATDV